MKYTDDENFLEDIESEIDSIIDVYYAGCVEEIIGKIRAHLLEIRTNKQETE